MESIKKVIVIGAKIEKNRLGIKPPKVVGGIMVGGIKPPPRGIKRFGGIKVKTVWVV